MAHNIAFTMSILCMAMHCRILAANIMKVDESGTYQFDHWGMVGRVPFSGIGRFWESPNARLMVNFFHPLGTGVHLTPGGQIQASVSTNSLSI